MLGKLAEVAASCYRPRICPPLLICADFYYVITHWYARAASLSRLSFKHAKCALGNQHSFTDASLHGQLHGDALFVPHQILAKVEMIKAERARVACSLSGSAKHQVTVVTSTTDLMPQHSTLYCHIQIT